MFFNWKKKEKEEKSDGSLSMEEIVKIMNDDTPIETVSPKFAEKISLILKREREEEERVKALVVNPKALHKLDKT